MQSLEDAQYALEDARNKVAGLKLLNATTLRGLGLTTSEIKTLPPVYQEEKAYPRYQLEDVQALIDSKKTKPTK